MRISSSMVYKQLSLSLRESADNLSVLNTRLATGKKLTKPSDDPQASLAVTDYKVSLDKNGVYASNIDKAATQFTFTNAVLGGVEGELTALIKIVREAGVTSEDRMQALAAMVETARNQLLSHANSRLNDKYLFSGFLTDRPAFDEKDYSYKGDEGKVSIPVGEATEIPLNLTGREVFSFAQAQKSATLGDGTVVTYSQDPVTQEVTVSFSDDAANSFSFSNIMEMTNVLRWSLESRMPDGTTALSRVNAMHRIESLAVPFNNAYAQVTARQADIAARLSISAKSMTFLKSQASAYRGAVSSYEDADPIASATEALQARTAHDVLNASAGKILSESIFALLR